MAMSVMSKPLALLRNRLAGHGLEFTPGEMIKLLAVLGGNENATFFPHVACGRCGKRGSFLFLGGGCVCPDCLVHRPMERPQVKPEPPKEGAGGTG
jgi:hypothetical protein